MQLHTTGVEAGHVPVTEQKAHDRAEKIKGEIFVRERRLSGAPHAFGSFIDNEQCTVGVSEVVKLAISVFGQNKRRIVGVLICRKMRKNTTGQGSGAFDPVGFRPRFKTKSETSRTRHRRIQAWNFGSGVDADTIGSVAVVHRKIIRAGKPEG